MSNKTYDKLKIVSMIVGYAIDFAIAVITIWHDFFPNAPLWSATVSALGVFLGSVLIASSKRYNADMAEHADDPDEGRG